jgi:V8-like Glu-specific endopeptidase
MIMCTKMRGVVIAAVILCIGQPWAFAQGKTTARVASEDDPAFFSQGVAYWTDERVRTLQPIPWYDEEADASASLFELEEKVLGPPDSAPSGSPGDLKKGRKSNLFLEQDGGVGGSQENLLAESESDFVDFGTQDIGDNDFVNQNETLWRQFPWKAIGKLLSNQGSCTASVISPNNIIVTAAHCCYNRSTGSWNSNFAFVPAMRDTTRPYGTFPYTGVRVPTAWITQGGRENDVCVLSLGQNANGQTVTSLNSWLGRSWDYPTTQHHFAFGYPANISSGRYKYECSAESYANCGNSGVSAMGCNMTNGSSGGPWIRVFKKFQGGAMNFVNSVVSGHDSCTGTLGGSFNGARFTSSNIVPLCNDEGC